jgi:hypothetical protein
MNQFTDQKADALRFITGFELKHGRSPSTTEVADGQFDGREGVAEQVVCALVIEGKVRRSPGSRRRRLQALAPIGVPRAPDGEPLHFIRVGGPQA